MPDSEHRIAALESNVYSLRQSVEHLRSEFIGVKELLGQDIRSYELLKRLIVSVDSDLKYDHDTIVMISDEERAWFRNMLTRERKREFADETKAADREWWQKQWGRWGIRLGALAAAATLLANALQILPVFHK